MPGKRRRQALAAIFKTEELFGAGITGLIVEDRRRRGGSFPVKGKWNEPEVQEYYKTLGATIANEIGGLPIKVRPLDAGFNRQWEIEIQ